MTKPKLTKLCDNFANLLHELISVHYAVKNPTIERFARATQDLLIELLLRNQDTDREQDTKLIDCNRCKCVLNGKSFWVMDGTAEIVCEDCNGEPEEQEEGD